MQFIYRLSPERPGGKPRPEWFSKENCLRNFLLTFGRKALGSGDFLLLADRWDDDKLLSWAWKQAATWSFVSRQPIRLDYGQGGPAFLAALEAAVQTSPRDGLVYLVEDDYLHCRGAAQILREGLELFDYVTLYDHPDKYMKDGPNLLVFLDGAESSCVYLSKTCHWKETNSTTMTFACRLETLRADADIFRQVNQGVVPQDFKTFQRLRASGRRIGSPIPSWSTHCESNWLSPLVDWAAVNEWSKGTGG